MSVKVDSIINSPTTSRGILATKTNDSAATGYVGERLEAIRTSTVNGSTVVDNFTDVTDCSLTLTAGDWLVHGTVVIYMTTSVLGVNPHAEVAIRTGSTVIKSALGAMTQQAGGVGMASTIFVQARISISSTGVYKLSFAPKRTSGSVWNNIDAFATADCPAVIAARRIR
jgi:hypothetical protein